MIREGHKIKLRSEEGLILDGTVLDYEPDDLDEGEGSLSVVTAEGDEFDFELDGSEWKRKGAYWHVVRSNPCAPCIGLNPSGSSRRSSERSSGRPSENPMAYEHLPTREQERLHGLMEASQRARVGLMDAEMRGDRRSTARWRTKLQDAEKQIVAAERRYGPAYRNPAEEAGHPPRAKKRTKKPKLSVRALVARALK